jgi:uncharacterized protein
MKELLEAIEHDSLVRMRALLEAGADLKAPVVIGAEYDLEDYDETGILFWAIRNYASRDAIELLLEYGVDLCELDGNGISALDTAIKFKRHEIIELCVERGIDVNATSRKSGITPLMLAACFSSLETIEILLAHGADINAIDHNGMSPKDYARKLGQKRVLEYLNERGGRHSAYAEA